MTGEEVELCQGGRSLTVRYSKLVINNSFKLYLSPCSLTFFHTLCDCVLSWENKDVYARAVRSLRLRELQNIECMTAVRAGLGSIIPLQLLTMLIPLEMELRTCGLPYINLEFLKVMNVFVLQWTLHYKASVNIYIYIAAGNICIPRPSGPGRCVIKRFQHYAASLTWLHQNCLTQTNKHGCLSGEYYYSLYYWNLILTPPLSPSKGSHHVSGGTDGDRPAHWVLLDGPGDVHSRRALQVHQVRLQPGAHTVHLPLQGRGARHRTCSPLPHEDRPPWWSCR